MRLRPDSEALEGWGLPGSRLRLTDPHLASYFRDLAANAGTDIAADSFDLASHALARSIKPQTGRWHLDLRLIGSPARLLFGAASQHAILAWHAPTAIAMLRLPGRAPVTLEHADPVSLCGAQLALDDIATLSAWMPTIPALAEWLQALAPFMSNETRAVIRMPGEALASLVAILPGWPVKPVAILPCEPEPGDDDADRPLDILLCLEALSTRAPRDSAARTALALPPLTMWQPGEKMPERCGLVATRLDDSPVAAGLMLTLIGDAPATQAGAELDGLQRNPLRAETGEFLRLDATAARLDIIEGRVVVQTVRGVAAQDPAAVAEIPVSVPRAARLREVVDRPALLLGASGSREAVLGEILPRLELACELIEREKLAPDGIELVCPNGADDFLRAALDLCGFGTAPIRVATEGVLFRRLILASDGCAMDAPRCSAMFDRFWSRVSTMRLAAANWSLTAPRPTGRVLLLGPDSLILNAADLAVVARDREYAVIDPDIALPQAIASLLRDATVVISPSRTGIWSVLARNSALGLLQSDVDPVMPYPALHAASARRHSVLAMFGSGIGDDPESGFVIASDRLALMMDRLEAMADGMRTGVGG